MSHWAHRVDRWAHPMTVSFPRERAASYRARKVHSHEVVSS